MATVPSNNVAQVSGMTPEGASLAANVADQAGQNSRMAAQLQLEQQKMAQDRELQQFHAELSKEMQREQLKARKDEVNLELSEKRRSEIEAANARKEEQALVMQLRLNEEKRADLLQQAQQAGAEGRFEAEEMLYSQLEQMDEKIEGQRQMLQRVGRAVTGFDKWADSVKTNLGKGGALDQFIMGESERFNRLKNSMSTIAAQDLIREYNEIMTSTDENAQSDDKNWALPPAAIRRQAQEVRTSKLETFKGKMRNEIAGVVTGVANLNPEVSKEAFNDVAVVIGLMEKPALSAEEKAIMDAALGRLDKAGVDRDLISVAISAVGSRLRGGSLAETSMAGDSIPRNPDGTLIPTGGEALDPLKDATTPKLWDLYKSTYVRGAQRNGFEGIRDTVGDDYLESRIAPTRAAVTKLIEDLTDNGRLDGKESQMLLEQIKRMGSRGVQLMQKIEAEAAQGGKVVDEFQEFATPGAEGAPAVLNRVELGRRQQSLQEEYDTGLRRRDTFEKRGNVDIRRKANQSQRQTYQNYNQQSQELMSQNQVQVDRYRNSKQSADNQFLGGPGPFTQ